MFFLIKTAFHVYWNEWFLNSDESFQKEDEYSSSEASATASTSSRASTSASTSSKAFASAATSSEPSASSLYEESDAEEKYEREKVLNAEVNKRLLEMGLSPNSLKKH